MTTIKNFRDRIIDCALNGLAASILVGGNALIWAINRWKEFRNKPTNPYGLS